MRFTKWGGGRKGRQTNGMWCSLAALGSRAGCGQGKGRAGSGGQSSLELRWTLATLVDASGWFPGSSGWAVRADGSLVVVRAGFIGLLRRGRQLDLVDCVSS